MGLADKVDAAIETGLMWVSEAGGAAAQARALRGLVAVSENPSHPRFQDALARVRGLADAAKGAERVKALGELAQLMAEAGQRDKAVRPARPGQRSIRIPAAGRRFGTDGGTAAVRVDLALARARAMPKPPTPTRSRCCKGWPATCSEDSAQGAGSVVAVVAAATPHRLAVEIHQFGHSNATRACRSSWLNIQSIWNLSNIQRNIRFARKFKSR